MNLTSARDATPRATSALPTATPWLQGAAVEKWRDERALIPRVVARFGDAAHSDNRGT